MSIKVKRLAWAGYLMRMNNDRSPTDKNTKHTQMIYTCGHILRNNTNSTNANQREE